MVLSGKQKRHLRSLIAVQPAIIHIGKGGLNPNLIQQINDALVARELIKIKILPNSDLELKETAQVICTEVTADLVQIIGFNIVLFKENPKLTKSLVPSLKAMSRVSR